MSIRATTVNAVRARAATQAKPVIRWALGHALPRTAMRIAARRGDLQGRLLMLPAGGDPFSLLEEVRSKGSVYQGKFAKTTTSLPVVKDILTSPDFRSGLPTEEMPGPLGRIHGWAAETGVLGPLSPPSLLVANGADHVRYRKLVTRVFTVRAVEALRFRTEEIADGLLDSLAGRDVVDLVETYAALLPVTVIAEILGVPKAETSRVLGFGAGAAPGLDMGLSWKRFRVVERSLAGFDSWLGEHLEQLRQNPGEDLLSQLVAVQDEGVGLNEQELKAIAGLVLVAGFETTVNLLGNGTALLCENRDQLTVLRANPSLWPNAVDEVLRLDPPVLLTARTATVDTEVGGAQISAGELIVAHLAGANRDPSIFQNPTTFDVARANAKDHVTFS
ncbi:MAG: cytochrome P450, partial [Jatrophihabitans sp.]